MRDRYQSKKTALESHDYTVLTSQEEFKETEIFRFRCNKGHETEQKYTSLNNRISALQRGECEFLCGKCCLREPVLRKLQIRLKELGFELVSLGDDNLTVEYKCTCGEISKTNTKNMHKASRQSTCNKCGNKVKAEAHKKEAEIITQESVLQNLHHGFKCIVEGCTDYAYYGGKEKPFYCDHHNSRDEKRFHKYTRRICIALDCTKRSSFNYQNGQIPLFCLDHKELHMVNVNSMKCSTCGNKNARFNTKEGYPKPAFCIDHRTDDMVDCLEKLCNPPLCWKQGTFAFHRFDKNFVCKEHQEKGMKDVKNLTRMCEFMGCEKQSNYNFVNEKRAIRCKEHKELGMVDMYHDRCLEEGCFSRSVYNYEHESKGLYCVKHKKDGMIDVMSIHCQNKSCKKQACFNLPGNTKAVFCDQHKMEGMVDVKNRNCKYEGGCGGQSSYGFIGEKACRCRVHSEKGMIKYPNRRCDESSCKNSAQYGFEGCFPVYCEIHHDSNQHVNLVEQVCNSCGLMNILRDGLCLFCNPASKREILKKQNDVRDWLYANGYHVISCDKRIDGGACGKERPDFVLETDSGFFVVIEIDEFQHFSYISECENTRMINISQSLGGPTMFIRFNPDNYTVGKSKQHVRLADRYKVLKKWLDTCVGTSVESIKEIGFCSQVKLFYNEFNEKNCEWETLLAFEQ
jgi:hypothetical protein